MTRGGSNLMFGGSFCARSTSMILLRFGQGRPVATNNETQMVMPRNGIDHVLKFVLNVFSNSMIWIDLPKVVHIRDTKKLILSCLGTGLVLTCNLSISMICFDFCKVVHIRQTMRITSPFRLARVHEHRSHKRHQHWQITTGMDYR